ncbi:Phagocyte signaling-impaired protein [Gryllus bimaculatus]|nr:Phagocyte signaling-impaired protein [Gryllus bimaculatus]
MYMNRLCVLSNRFSTSPKVILNMAAKTHVDSSVGERRLRPIYEWLDNGNNKKALQEAEKVLKKQPNFLCAKVLKALALLRLGKEEECDHLLEAVRAEVPADDSTLQAMTICYREVHRPERICAIYEAAVRKEPGSEELLTHLFMAYVRVADYKKQQKTALQLYKLKPKNPYYFWAVMSVVMQAHKAEPQLAQGVVLPLAERMVQKLVNEDRIEAEQEVQLYLMVLEMQSKYEEALRVVEGPLGEKLVSYVVVPLKRASLLMKLERWREANVLYKQLLREDMDRWSYLMNYLTTSLKLFDSGQQNGNNNTMNNSSSTANNNINNNRRNSSSVADSPHEQLGDDANESMWREPDSSPTACCRFLAHLVTTSEKESQRRLRGPYLAQLELFRLLSDRGMDAEPLLGKPADLLIRYVELFAEKPCCVSDLRRFLPLLPESERSSFIQKVTAATVWDPVGGVADLQRHVCGLQLTRMLGAHLEMTETQRQVLATELLLYYKKSMHLSTENLQTEFACNDPYALLAAHVLVDSYLATGHSAPLVRAAQTLEMALERSPSNFHVKLLLLRVYSVLGAGAAADAVYEMLDVKHMQLDSLGYLHCAQLAALGQLRAAAALYEITLKFFTANYKDGVDHLTYSYKFGSFLKIMEFVEFCERLNNSLHYAMTTVERMLLEVMECPTAAQARTALSGMEVQPWKDSVAWDALQDNRDTSILVGWEPPCR